ncbi:MAG: RNase P subunit p30 family protein [Candidatus Aenigmatarchaeota archaeon]
MRAYDLHVHASPFGGENSAEEVVEFAKKLGWSGVALCCSPDSESFDKQLKILDSLKTSDFDVVKAVEIKAENLQEFYKTIDSVRKKVEIIVVSGGDIEVNKAAVETKEVDVLSHPERQRNDSGIDAVMAKTAADNQVHIELNFREVLNSYRKSRVHVLSHMRQNLKLSGKYGFPIAITSGAYSKWELRAPRELAAFGLNLGMHLDATFQSLAVQRLDINRQKLSKDWVMPGVTLVDN